MYVLTEGGQKSRCYILLSDTVSVTQRLIYQIYHSVVNFQFPLNCTVRFSPSIIIHVILLSPFKDEPLTNKFESENISPDVITDYSK